MRDSELNYNLFYHLFILNRAPQGCLQYFFENVNTITSLNWDGLATRSGTGGGVLANQDYKICIKQNPGKLKHYIIYRIHGLLFIISYEVYILLHDFS